MKQGGPLQRRTPLTAKTGLARTPMARASGREPRNLTQATVLPPDPCKRTGCSNPVAGISADGIRLCSRHLAQPVSRVQKLKRNVGSGWDDAKHKAANRKKNLQSKWRQKVARKRPLVCVASGMGGCKGRIECDHIQPKSQGGTYDPDNGAFLCTEHHRQKTDSLLQYRWEWLDDDQRAFLAAAEWVRWDADGQPYGRGRRHFATMTSAQIARREKGGTTS